MFGGGGNFGWKEALAAGLAGFVSRQNPMALQGLMQALMARQRQKQDEYDYNRQRQDKRDDFTFEQDYKAAHPTPVNNDTVADYNFWKGVLPPDQFEQYVANKVNPPQLMEVPGVGLVSVPRMSSPQATPAAPVGKLRPYNPGGPTPGASGGFPGGY
jgi:hypothetical protein